MLTMHWPHTCPSSIGLGHRAERWTLYKLLPTKSQGVGNMHKGSTGYNGCAKQVAWQTSHMPPFDSWNKLASQLPFSVPLYLDPDSDTLPLVSATTVCLHLLAQHRGVGQGGLQWSEALAMHHDHLENVSTGPISKKADLISVGWGVQL